MARGDDDDAFGRQAVGDDELVGQRGAGGHQQVAATVERTIEPSLHGPMWAAVIDAAGGLVQNGS